MIPSKNISLRKRLNFNVTSLILGFIFLLFGGFTQSNSQQWPEGYEPGVVIMKLTPTAMSQMNLSIDEKNAITTGIDFFDDLIQAHQITSLQPALPYNPEFADRHNRVGIDRWFFMETANKGSELLIIETLLQKNSYVEYAEPDFVGELLSDPVIPFPNDPRIGDQWHYNNTGLNNGRIGADISLFGAWEITTGLPEVIVQVVDSGIATTNTDVRNMLWVNPTPNLPGYNFSINGWNFRSGNNNIDDEDGHGTHVAGVIAAQTNNGIGISGIAGGDGSGNGARLMIARLFEPAGGSGAVQTFNAYIFGADNGAVISNNSWGYRDPNVFPTIVRDGIDYFIDNAGFDANGNVVGPIAGGVVIFASGNRNSNETYFPGAYSRVINVSATNNRDEKAVYSNFGSHVDISAPGGELSPNQSGGVLSTEIASRGTIGFRQGTSMAAPHVSGVAALMASHFVNISNTEMVERILAAVDNIDSINPQFQGLMGSGRLNATKALTTDSPPAIPRLVFPAQDGDDIQQQMMFSWRDAPLATSYQVQVSTNADFSDGAIIFDAITSEVSIAFSDLSLSSEYFWRVRGVNQFGEGRWSEVFRFTTTDRVPPISPQLAQNFPNPFNPSTVIEFGLSENTNVTLEVYNVLGQRVATVFSGPLTTGWHTKTFNATGLSSGMYFYRLRTQNSSITRKMLLVK